MITKLTTIQEQMIEIQNRYNRMSVEKIFGAGSIELGSTIQTLV